MNRFSTQQNGMTNSFFFLFGVYRVLEKSSSNVNVICSFCAQKSVYYVININNTGVLLNIFVKTMIPFSFRIVLMNIVQKNSG